MTALQEAPAIEAPEAPLRRHAAPESVTVLPSAVGRRWWRPRLTAAIVGVVVLGVVGAFLVGARPASAQVLFVVDGVPRTVTTDVATVGELLTAQGVAIGPHDTVTPASATLVAEAPTVTVAYGRQVALTVDGVTSQVWTTADDVRDLLAERGLPADSASDVGALAPIDRSGAKITVTTPKPVTVRVDGAAVALTTTAATVGAALDVPEVGLTPADRISVPADTPVRAGATYVVTRVESDVQQVRQVLGATTRWVDDPDLPTGQTQVRQTGADGLRVREVRLRYENGRVAAHTVLSDRRTPPVPWVIARGTGPAGSDVSITYERDWTPATGKVDGEPDFAALAKCESGGNPRAVSPTGKYRGLYQFDLRTWHGVGGVGDPIDATPQEQTKRARILYNDRGRTPWPYCGRYL